MTILTKTDKIQLIDSRVRSVEYKRYSLGLDLIVENAKFTTDQNAIDVIENAIDESGNQITALELELVEVNKLTE